MIFNFSLLNYVHISIIFLDSDKFISILRSEGNALTVWFFVSISLLRTHQKNVLILPGSLDICSQSEIMGFIDI